MSLMEDEVQKHTSKRKRRVGLWRAWVRHQTLGQQGSPSFAALAATYREAQAESAPVLDELRKLVKSAQAAYLLKGAHKTHSILGPRSREQLRLSQKLARQGVWARCRRMKAHQRAGVIAGQVGAEATLDEALSAARKHDILDGAARRKALAEDVDVLQQFAAEQEPMMLSPAPTDIPPARMEFRQLHMCPRQQGMDSRLSCSTFFFHHQCFGMGQSAEEDELSLCA